MRLLKIASAACVVIFFLVFCAAKALAEEVKDQKDWIKGGVAAKSNSGQCFYKPFIYVGDIEDNDEGEAQIIGYTPGNAQVSRLHPEKIVWERVLLKRFARRGFPAKGCMEKCPPYDE